MDFDPTTLVPTPTNWLNTRVCYEGTARAEFVNPPGTVEGSATVSVSPSGSCRVRIAIEKIEAPDEKKFNLGSGSAPAGTFFINGFSNPCRSLTVTTAEGVFIGGERITHAGVPLGAQKSVELHPLRSKFEVTDAPDAKYWVLPLSNFIPEVWKGAVYKDLDGHPLRLARWPEIPEGLPENDATWAAITLAQRAGLLTFLLNGETGFIERMPRYDALVKRVRRDRSRRVTAVMVGPAHVQSVDWADPASLFPLDILGMLSLVTGTTAGAPWIEFRDGDGALVRRDHICFGAGRYDRFHPAQYNPLLFNGPGYVTGRVLAAADRGQKYLRAAVNHALAAIRRGTIESKFISLCRGFETLCRHHRFISQNLSARLEPGQQTTVKELLRETAGRIRAMQRAETDPGRRSALDTIASRTQSAAQTEKSFGLAVTDLAKKFGFHDERVLDAHFAARPHATGKTWPGILTHYRAAATHDAYFDFHQPEDLYAILRVAHHLHDLLLRVLLKTIGYDGPYYSPIPPLMQRDSLDWVTPTTPPELLGFA